jgi:hypothetical protein
MARTPPRGYKRPMQLPSALRNLDDRVLGRKGDAQHARAGDDADNGTSPAESDPTTGPAGSPSEPETAERGLRTGAQGEPPPPPSAPRRPPGDVVRAALGPVWRLLRLALLALALVVALGIALTFAPTNDDNVIVRNLLSWAEWAAGPFRDVFTDDEPRRELLYNYALATGVYLVLASLVGRLPGARSSR